MAGEGPFFSFGILYDGLELIVGKAWENGDFDGFLAVVVGEGESPFLEGKAAESFIEVEVMEGGEAGESEIALGEAVFEEVFAFEPEEKLLIRQQGIGVEELGVGSVCGSCFEGGLLFAGQGFLLFFEDKIGESGGQTDIEGAADDEGLREPFGPTDPGIVMHYLFPRLRIFDISSSPTY